VLPSSSLVSETSKSKSGLGSKENPETPIAKGLRKIQERVIDDFEDNDSL